MKWLKHMTATWDDERVARLVDKSGMEGLAMYGLYWRVQEIIASQMEGIDPHCSVRYTVTRWSLLLSLRGSLVFSALSRLAVTGLVTVQRTGNDILVTNRNLLKYRDEYSKKSRYTPDNVPTRTEGEGEGEQNKKEKEQNPYPTPQEPGADGDEKEEIERLKAEVKAAEKLAKELVKAAGKEEAKKIAAAKKVAAKKASPPTKTEYVKTRHAEFKVAIFNYWKSKNPNIDCPWQQAEGVQLEMWLKASPNTPIEQFKKMLRNRYRSPDVTHSERPSVWIKNITNFAHGPLDRYGRKPNGGNNGRVENNGSAIQGAFADILRDEVQGGDPDEAGGNDVFSGGGGESAVFSTNGGTIIEGKP